LVLPGCYGATDTVAYLSSIQATYDVANYHNTKSAQSRDAIYKLNR